MVMSPDCGPSRLLATARRSIASAQRTTLTAKQMRFLSVVLFLFIAFIATLVRRSTVSELGALGGGGAFVFFLINLNILILIVLVFLVGRSVIKLIFDRKRNLLGSRLRTRLVTAFVGMTLVPTGLLFWLANGFINRAMDGWFTAQMDGSKAAAVTILQSHYRLHKSGIERDIQEISGNLRVHAKRLQKPEILKQRLERLRKEFDLYSLHYMVGKTPENTILVQNAAALVEPFQEPELDSGAVDRALGGERETLFEEKGASKYVRSYAPLSLTTGHPGCIILARRLNPELADAYATLVDSYQSYEQLKLMKSPLRSSLALTFSLVTGLILFGAIWISFHIARQIVIPIEQIGEATIRVARGDYESRLEPAGDDELGYLVDSFNHMITDLKVSRDEAERRRVYTETILSNLAVGVLTIGPNRQILSGNRSARRILDCESPEGHPIQEVIPPEQFRSLEPLLLAAEQDSDGLVSDIELMIRSQDRELRVLCTVGRIGARGGEYEASVLILDDITELMKAQSIMAWREVARRIAHEIKNPLTPLQLSAQRLQRLLADSEHDEVIRDSTLTIVEHVDSIKRLANEFSNFARMPTAEFSSTDLNKLVGDLLLGYEDQAMNVTVQFIPETKLPLVMFDREQVRRGILNLIDNAMAALQESGTVDPKVVIRTRFDRKRQMATIEIADNGPGVPHGDKTRIFNPYFTTKKGGTGLGLAIVSSVVADHHGRVSVVDNSPRGAKFIIELPVSQNTAVTQRLFGGESKTL